MELELTESLTEIARLAAEPFFAWHDHRSVLYWPFLLSALLLAIVVWISQTKPGLQPCAVGDLRRTLFARRAIVKSCVWHAVISSGPPRETNWRSRNRVRYESTLFAPACIRHSARWFDTIEFSPVFSDVVTKHQFEDPMAHSPSDARHA